MRRGAHVQALGALQLAGEQLEQRALAGRGRAQQQREAPRRQRAAEVAEDDQPLLLRAQQAQPQEAPLRRGPVPGQF